MFTLSVVVYIGVELRVNGVVLVHAVTAVCVLPHHEIALRMPTLDPKLEEIVEHDMWRGERDQGSKPIYPVTLKE